MRSINTTFFQNPVDDPDYSVSCFWFWNDLIKKEQLSEQLDMMKQINANQPMIHARKGLINEYLSEDWFSLFKFTVEECRKNNQKCWIYDEKDWPSGTCGLSITRNEEYREHFLQFDSFCVEANEVIDLGMKLSKQYISGKAFLENVKKG